MPEEKRSKDIPDEYDEVENAGDGKISVLFACRCGYIFVSLYVVTFF